MKKLISIFLTLIMLLGIFTCTASAEKDEYMDIPLIRIIGTGEPLYAADGTKLVLDYDIMIDSLLENFEVLLEKFLKNTITGGDYEQYAQELYNAVVPMFDGMLLDKNGDSINGVHPPESVANPKTSDYGLWDYRFEYDWRLSPMVLAAELKDYIEDVYAASSGKKVVLNSRCYASNIVAAYIRQYPDHAKQYVERISYYTPSIIGIDYIGAFFSGQIFLDGEAVDNFVTYFLNDSDFIEDENLKTFITTFVTLLNKIKLLGLTTEAFSEIVRNVCDYAVPMICRDSFANYPSYWSMIGEEYYEDAMEYIYGDCREEYKGLIEKCDNYYNNVTLKFDEICDITDSLGIRTILVAKYNCPLLPLSENATAQGDGYTSVSKQTFGEAVSADYGHELSKSFIDSLETTDYLSPDKKIDASLCRYRDTTWFVKNLYHDHFPGAENTFFLEALKGGIDIHSDERFPQYLEYSTDENGNRCFAPVTGPDPAPEKETTSGVLAILIRWFTAFFNIITQIINGEFNLSFDL